MKPVSRKSGLMLAAGLGLIGIAWWGGGHWVQQREKARIIAAAPALPDRAAMPDALRAGLEAATALAMRGDQAGLVELAALYAANGWEENARRCLAALRQIDPENQRWAAESDPWGGQLYQWCFDGDRLMNEAEKCIADRDNAAARLRVERALHLEPRNGRLHWRAALVWEVLRDQVRAMQHYEQAVDYDATLADAWLRLATLQRAIGETSRAWNSLVAGVKANPASAPLLLARGNAYAEREQFEKALLDFQQVIAIMPDDPAGYLESGRVLFALARPDEAVSTVERALDVQPENPIVLVTLAVMALSTKDQAEADRWLARIDAAGSVPAQDRAQLQEVYRRAFEPESPAMSP